jgi:CCR4-NOT transcription complex subunit 1
LRSHSINTLQPAYFPGFTFSWVALISHRLFMPKLLRDREGQAAFLRLLQSLLRLLEPHLAPGVVMSDMIRSLYSATCKIFLVLLHDFPEFLSAFHITLCDAIPTSCIQLQVGAMLLSSVLLMQGLEHRLVGIPIGRPAGRPLRSRRL